MTNLQSSSTKMSIPNLMCSLLLFFAPCNVFASSEMHLKTNLRLGQDFRKNFRQPSQPMIKSLDHPFGV